MIPTVIITKSVRRTLVRKQVFEVKDLESVLMVFERLLSERHTGPVTVNLNCGGLRGMIAEDKAELPENT